MDDNIIIGEYNSNNSQLEFNEIIFGVEIAGIFLAKNGTFSGTEFTIVQNNELYSNDQNIEVDSEYIESEFEGEEDLSILSSDIEIKGELQSGIPENFEVEGFTASNTDYNDPYFVGPEWKSYNVYTAFNSISKTKYGPSYRFSESLKKILYYIKNDPNIIDLIEAAYLLATSYAESGYSLQRWEGDYLCTGIGIPYDSDGPCQRALNYYKSDQGKKNYYTLGIDSKGLPYFGRGLIQLTGKDNYDMYGKLIKKDLLLNGDLAMESQNSYKIASIYMRYRTFKYVLSGNLEKARKSVNGGTKGIDEVNGAFSEWVNILKNSLIA